jgi:GntR family transcriptional regulator
MLQEQHLRKVEASLSEAIQSARVAGISSGELRSMLEALLEMEES